MSNKFTFTIDGVEVEAESGQSILEAAEAVGIYIPRLCFLKEIIPHGSCRVCTVLVNGRAQSACTQPAAANIVVENDTEELRELRKSIIDMLFVEGNHYCMFCEKSGKCELQALAYRFGITAPQYPYMFPKKDVDATHPDVFLDRNRCILCGRCVRVSKSIDGKNVFQFVNRGLEKRVAVNAEAALADTNLDLADQAVKCCPVGAILPKRVGFDVPIGQRRFDKAPIGSEVEAKAEKSV